MDDYQFMNDRIGFLHRRIALLFHGLAMDFFRHGRGLVNAVAFLCFISGVSPEWRGIKAIFVDFLRQKAG